MARTVIVSNRVNLPQERASLPGGLAVVMREALWKNGGVWFGWSGSVAEEEAEAPRALTCGAMTYVTADLTRAEYEQYYLGFSNASLWPVLHYRLGLADYHQDQYEGYLRVNARFAQLLSSLLEPDNVAGCMITISSPSAPPCGISASEIRSASSFTPPSPRPTYSRLCRGTKP